jgi:hypothetical protein
MERTATFEVVRFDKPYIGKADTPDLNWSFASSLSDYIVVRGVSVGEESYSITLQWQTRTQKFEIVSISKD